MLGFCGSSLRTQYFHGTVIALNKVSCLIFCTFCGMRLDVSDIIPFSFFAPKGNESRMVER